MGKNFYEQIEYQTCIANPSGCTELYAARPRQRVRALDALSVAEWLGGGGRRVLWGNGITGTIPTNLYLLTSLTRMYASCRPPAYMSR